MRGRGPDPVFPLSFTTIPHPEPLSSLSRIPFFFSDFGESRFPSSGQFPYRVQKFGVFPNPACISCENTLPDPVHTRISFSFPILHLCPNFGESRSRRSNQIPYPVNVSRIPPCISVKSRSLGIPL